MLNEDVVCVVLCAGIRGCIVDYLIIWCLICEMILDFSKNEKRVVNKNSRIRARRARMNVRCFFLEKIHVLVYF